MFNWYNMLTEPQSLACWWAMSWQCLHGRLWRGRMIKLACCVSCRAKEQPHYHKQMDTSPEMASFSYSVTTHACPCSSCSLGLFPTNELFFRKHFVYLISHISECHTEKGHVKIPQSAVKFLYLEKNSHVEEYCFLTQMGKICFSLA